MRKIGNLFFLLILSFLLISFLSLFVLSNQNFEKITNVAYNEPKLELIEKYSVVDLNIISDDIKSLGIPLALTNDREFEGSLKKSNFTITTLKRDFKLTEVQGYDFINVSDAYYAYAPGMPNLPRKTLSVELGKDEDISNIRITGGSYKTLESINILPVSQANLSESSPFMTEEEILQIYETSGFPGELNPDKKIYSSSSIFPYQFLYYNIEFENGKKIAKIRVPIVAYNPKDKKAYLFTSLDIKVNTGTIKPSPFPETPKIVQSSSSNTPVSSTAVISATAPSVEWEKTFGSGVGNSVQQTSDGGYIVAGLKNNDVYLVKTDQSGNKQWEKTYGGTSWDEGYSVQQTSDGGYIVAGEFIGCPGCFGISGYVYLIKTNGNGNSIWQKMYAIGGGRTGPEYNRGYSVQQTSDGGYIVAGSTNALSLSTNNIYLIKTDKDGSKEWEKIIGSSDYELGYSVQQTSDGGYIVAGLKNNDVYLVKTDQSGNKQWEKTYGGSSSNVGYSVQQTSDGGYIITGETDSFGAGGYDVYLVKTDNNGNKQWEKTYGGTGWDKGYSVQQTNDGGYIIGGYSNPSGSDNYDAYIIKVNSNGNIEWENIYGENGDQYGYSLDQTSDDGYIVTGESNGNVYLIKLSSDSNPQPTCTDNIKNGDETDIDCGGGSCKTCSEGKSCKINTDCKLNYCSNFICKVPIQEPTCTDGIKNGDETAVDCGGGSCKTCSEGKSCKLSVDCSSNYCLNSVCGFPNCYDGIKNGIEVGIDCGGGCSAVCGYCTPLIKNGPAEDKIDIVFIPDKTYNGLTGTFLNDVNKIIEKSFKASDPINKNINKFNFYYVKEEGKAGNINDIFPNHKPPKDFKKECSFYDGAAIIHVDEKQDFNDMKNNIFSSQRSNYGTVLHESGHAIFGLADEYGTQNTSRFYPFPKPNVYPNEDSCRSDAISEGWNPNDCTQYCIPGTFDCNEFKNEIKYPQFWLKQDGWWRSDDNPDIMKEPSSPEEPPLPFQRADIRRINWIFSLYPNLLKSVSTESLQLNNENMIKTLVFDLEFNEGSVKLKEFNIVYNSPPDNIDPNGEISITLLDKNKLSLESTLIWDPRIIYSDGLKIISPQADANVRFNSKLKERYIQVDIYNGTKKIPQPLIEITPYVKSFCEVKDNICDLDCLNTGVADIDCKSEDPDKELVAFYKFEKNLLDAMNGNNGSGNGLTYVKKGRKFALHFNNIGDFFTAKITSHNLDTSDFSIKGVVRTKDASGSIINNINNNNQLSVSLVKGRLIASLSDGTTTAKVRGKKINDGKWHNFLLSLDRDGKMRLKVDKTAIIESDISQFKEDSLSGEFLLGTKVIGQGDFAGDIDYLKIWNYAVI